MLFSWSHHFCEMNTTESELTTGQIDSITFVGGGDNGILTALALEQRLSDVDITIIDDFEEPQPQVGKSTLTSFVDFLHDVLEIDRKRLFYNVPLAFKTTIYFKDWCSIDSFHSPLGMTLPAVTPDSQPQAMSPDPEAEFNEFYYRYQEREFSEIYGEVAEHPGTMPHEFETTTAALEVQQVLPDAAYHFNTQAFNEFLRTLCEERGIELVNDRIREVEITNNRIDRLGGETTDYMADLYVDASGFNRVLMSELDNSFVELDVPVDSTVKTTTDISLSDVVSGTVVTTGDAGWIWQIDTYTTRDIGYVYSSSHISEQAAKQELVEMRDEAIDPDDIRHYQWEPGILEKAWVSNCVAAGNALAFAEPLHSFALTAAASLALRLANLLGNHGRINHEGLRNLYNECARAKWDEIYKFQSVFYRFNSGSTPFWEDARSVDSGQIEQYDAYQESGFAAPNNRDTILRTGTDQNRFYLYYLAFRNLEVDSEFFESLDFAVDPEIITEIKDYTASLSDEVDDLLSYEEFYHTLKLDFE